MVQLCFVSSYNDALKLLNRYKEICKRLGIIINCNKTKISNNYNFIYCKWKYIISSKIKIVPVKSTIYRQRRTLRRMLKRNIDYRLSLNSYCAYLDIGNSYKYIEYLNNIIYKENSVNN